jgi:ketosteroid isomerase-like protein
MNRERVAAWIAGYERAWRTPGTEALGTLFTPHATYLQEPYGKPVTGLRAIAAMWEAERDGPGEAFTMTSEVLAVEGDTAVARIEVVYHEPPREYRDLWIMRFTPDGRCREYEEWPFWPGKGYAEGTSP